MAYRAANRTSAVPRVSTRENKKLTPSRRRKVDIAYTVRSGEEGDEECLLPNAVPEIRCWMVEEIPGKSSQLLNNTTKHPPR